MKVVHPKRMMRNAINCLTSFDSIGPPCCNILKQNDFCVEMRSGDCEPKKKDIMIGRQIAI
jgi:hypothetical protein